MVALLAVCPRTILTLPGGTIVRRSPEQLQREMDGLLAFVHTPFTGGRALSKSARGKEGAGITAGVVAEKRSIAYPYG
jgi:hypothetical protein